MRSFDGLRVVAIFFVIVFHFLHAYKERWTVLYESVLSLTLFFFPFFFIGTGYLFSRKLQAEIKESGRIRLLPFYLRRVFRIWPVYFVALGLHALVEARWNGFDLLTSALFISNFFEKSFFLHSWTVCVEEQFYLLCPFLMLLLHRRNFFWPVFTIVFFTSIAVRWLLEFHLEYELQQNYTLAWSDGFLVGILIAHPWAERAKPFLQAQPALLQLALFVLYLGSQTWLRNTPIEKVGWFLCTGLFVLITLTPSSAFGSFLAKPLFRYLADRSYALYMFHILAIQWVTSSWKAETGVEVFALLIAVVVTAHLFSEVSFWIIEKPVERLRNRLLAS